MDWHPVQHATAVEWFLRHSTYEDPYAVIRMIDISKYGDRDRPDNWYRVVTWSRVSENRELIGWCRTLEAAAGAGWDWSSAARQWQHDMAAKRMHERPGGMPKRPPAADLLRAYREAMTPEDRRIRMGG